MSTRITQQATAFALAAFVTIGVLSGLNGLAAGEVAAAQAQFAQATTTQPA
jgi:hypothetical protein